MQLDYVEFACVASHGSRLARKDRAMPASMRYLGIGLLLIALLIGVTYARPRAAEGLFTSQWDMLSMDAGARGVTAVAFSSEAVLFEVYLPLMLSNSVVPVAPVRYSSDALYSNQWGLEKVNAPGAWSLSTGDGVVIAVPDTGVDLDHPDLEDKILTDIAKSFIEGSPGVDDDNGHGTHVAGIAAAATDNGIGIAGMGWDAMILPLKVLDADGWGNVVGLAYAIRYATDSGADVINLSLGVVGSCGWPLYDAVEYAYGKGVIMVAAAGNELANQEMIPVGCDHVIGVSATDEADRLAAYSNYGGHVSVAAPGSSIYSTAWPGDPQCWYREYCRKSGTSMATPYVSGLAALLLGRYPGYTPDEIASAILDNAVDLGTLGWDEEYGCGRVDAYASLSAGARGEQPVCLSDRVWSEESREETRSMSNAEFVPGQIIVQLQPDLVGASVLQQYTGNQQYLPTLDVWRLQVAVGEERAMLTRLRQEPYVVRADLNYIVVAQ